MRERINRLARGIIDNGSPELVLAPERVEASVPAGEVIRGEILVSSGNNLHIKGLVYSSHERVRVVNNAFGGLRNRIIYEVNVGFSEHGDEIKGSFYLVTNGGEREIPYSLRVQAGDSGEVLGNLKTPRDFGLLAKKDLEKALRMFEYQDFTEAPFMQDSRVRTIYDGLKGRAGRRNLLEEFLVALQVKEPVKLTLETGTRIYENLTGIAEDYIDIAAGTWGDVSADITVDAPFIEPGTFRITDQDFVQGRCRVGYRIVPSRLHRGRNFGCIRVKSLREEFLISVEAEGDHAAGNAERESGTDRFMDHGSLYKYLSLRLDYEAGVYEPALLLNQMMKETEHLRADFPGDERAKLIQAELLILNGREDNASLALDDARDHVLAHREEQVELYCFYQYLRLEIKPSLQQKESLVRYIRKLLWEDGEVRPYLFLMMMKLDETMAQNPLELYRSMASLFNQGCNSPFLYASACRLLEAHPDLFVRLGDFEIQALYLGVQKGIVSRATALKAAGLALGLKHYRKLVERLFAKLYQTYEEQAVLEAVCSLLIKGDCKEKDAFVWYEKALEQGINLTRLYEYFLYSLPDDYGHLLPKEVLLYFSYDKDLDRHSRQVLYRNILEYMNPSAELYQNYTRHMEQFAMEQLFQSRISRSLAVIYEHMIYKDMIDSRVARVLPGILKSCRIRCGDSRMKYVIVRYEELEDEEAFLLENQTAYVPLFSERSVLLFQDAYGNRYLDVKHWKVSVMDRPELLAQCYEVYPDHPMLKLSECRDIVNRGVETDDQAALLEEIVTQMHLSPVFEGRLMQAVTDYYCRKASEDKDGDGVFNCAYLVQIDKKHMAARQRQQICETLISQNYMREAYNMIRDYGSQYISTPRLMKLCTKTILMNLFDQDDLLLGLSHQVFCQGCYDSVILDYLCEHFNGTVSQMYEVLIQGVREHVETYDLEERLLGQMLFTGCCDQMDSVFELYMKRKTTKEMVVKAYFTQKSVQYFLEEKDMDQRVFEYLKQAVGNTFDKDRMPTIYLLALTRYFSTLDKVEAGDAELLKTMTSLLLEEGLVFPYTRELSKHIPVPEDIMDKAMVEYRGKKDAHPELQVRILPGETGYHSEDIRRVYQGIFVKQKVLFEGETMEYRIYDYLDGHRRLAAEGQVECDHKLEGKENSRFACLNEMGAAIKDRDDSRLLNAMEDYLKKSAALGRLFPME